MTPQEKRLNAIAKRRTTIGSSMVQNTIRSISLSGETWKRAKGYSSKYYVSNMGRILTTQYKGGYRVGIIQPAKDTNGYLRTVLDRKTVKVHRVVAQTFVPNPQNKPTVNHINGDKADNRVTNLEWATKEEQTQHALSTGLWTKEKFGNMKAAHQSLRVTTDEQLMWLWKEWEARTAGATQKQKTAVYKELLAENNAQFNHLTLGQLKSAIRNRTNYQLYASVKQKITTQ